MALARFFCQLVLSALGWLCVMVQVAAWSASPDHPPTRTVVGTPGPQARHGRGRLTTTVGAVSDLRYLPACRRPPDSGPCCCAYWRIEMTTAVAPEG